MEKLDQIIFTLEQIDVHGADNLSRMLGCIQALRHILSVQSQPEGDAIKDA